MPVNHDDRGIDHRVLHIWVIGGCGEHALDHAGLGPVAKAVVSALRCGESNVAQVQRRDVGGLRWNWSLVATVGVKLQQERKRPEHRRHPHHAAIAILDVGGMHDGERQQALRVDQDVALLVFDMLARVIAMPVRDPLFRCF
jgi:hypothetical protein